MKKQEFYNNVDPLLLCGIAHRGLHNNEFTENGLRAFENAINHNMAFELDVHLTKDGQLMVCHDDDLVRTTGKPGIIEELTAEEIKYSYRLLDGEQVPTLQDVLYLNNERVPIVIELKVHNKNYKPLAKRLLEELKGIKDYKKYHLISFDPRALWYVRKSKFTTSLLVTTSHEWTYFFKFLFDSVDLEYVMTRESRVKRYQKNHFVNVWTIETKEQFDECYPYVDVVTFQHLDANYVKNMLSEKNINAYRK